MMDRLEQSFHQATRFAADASHELKTPLAIMQGELESALGRAAVGSTEQQTFGNLLEEVDRLKHITRNLLLLARADAGQLKLSRESLDLSNLLENAIEDARVLAAPQELTFDLQIQPQLHVHGDRGLLTTAILNLLTNAVRYNEARGRIAVSCDSPGRQILLQIGNTGPGIPVADQPRLFTRFFRSTSAAERRPDGFGLGLSLAREIARAHGGDIVLEESRPGWTCFVLRLPMP
jgi:signal transduction histidine kinase